VQALLIDQRYHTIFLAPCGATVNLPWELVQVPEHADADREGTRRYVGLRRRLPRTYGLGELSAVLQRQPQYAGRGTVGPHATRTRTRGAHNARAGVVGNPLHAGADPLPHARTAAMALATRLRQRDFHLAPESIALLDAEATMATVDAALDDTFVL
jgi:hypothetical protein